MATLAEIRTLVDNWKDTIGPKIVNRQNAYFATHGRYWQGIVTPGVRPDDGGSVVPNYTFKPTDQATSWADHFSGANALPGSIPAQIAIDVYDGPLGKGYTITLFITKAGRLYARTWNVGPENRDAAWADVTPAL